MADKKSIFDLGDKFGYKSPFGDWIGKEKIERKKRVDERNKHLPTKDKFNNVKIAPLGKFDVNKFKKRIQRHVSNHEFCPLIGFYNKERKDAIIRKYGGEEKFVKFLENALDFAHEVWRTNGLDFRCYYFPREELFFDYSVDGIYSGKMYMEEITGGVTKYTNASDIPLYYPTKDDSHAKFPEHRILGYFIAHEFLHQVLGCIGYLLYSNTNHLSNSYDQHANFKEFHNLNTAGNKYVPTDERYLYKDFYRIWKPQLYIIQRYSSFLNSNLEHLNSDLKAYLRKNPKQQKTYLAKYQKIMLSKIDIAANSIGLNTSWQIENAEVSQEDMLNRINNFKI